MTKNKKPHDFNQDRDQAIARRALFYGVRFLRAPVWNILNFYLSQLARALPMLPAKIRDKFDLSVRKRDFRALARVLAAQVEGNSVVIGSNLDANFRNMLPRLRQRTLLHDDHRRLLSARRKTLTPVPITLSFVTYNSGRWLDAFFASLCAQRYPLAMLTVRFADQGSSDNTVAQIEKFFADQGCQFRGTMLVMRENDGFGGGHDANIRASDDEFILVSNLDIEFGPDTLTGLVAAACEDATDVACWEARQCPYEHPKFYDPVTLETAWCSHACILLRRSAYDAVGGYEERIFMYGEDVELSYRFRGAGWRLRYLPHVAVRHFVDFDDPTLRPHQLSGSISANVLLRYRYAGDAQGRAGEMLLTEALSQEHNPARRAALSDARSRIDRDREHYCTTRIPEKKGIFPFDGLDYEIGRVGHDTVLDSLDQLVDFPKVTIITRTHGASQGILREAIASVLNQTYPNIEHLIVEDRGNLSETLVSDVAAAYGSDTRFLRSNRGGRSATGNEGLAAATGDLLLFLDFDDLLFADHVELLVRALHAAPDSVAAYALSWELPSFFAASGTYREGHPCMPAAFAEPYAPKRFEQGNFIPIQAILFRRSLYEAEGGIDEEIDYLEDWNLWARYARHGRFKLVPKITSMFRVPGDPVFYTERQAVMLAAEDTVRLKTFGRTKGRRTH